MTLTALIVDDESLARRGLKHRLDALGSVTIVGEASNGFEACEMISELSPDLIFLDIQMPGMSGFELLEKLQGDNLPLIIFTTAYDEFAVKAFELNAIDYLLKPVDPARLALTLDNLRDRANPGAGAASPAPARPAPLDKVFVREGDRCWFVEVRTIRLLESEGNYTRLHFEHAQPQLFRSLNAMEARLDPKTFFRANRRQMINLEWIDKIEPWFSGGLLVEIKGGAKVELSRRQAQDFRERLSL